MAEPNESTTGNDSDQDFDPSAEMLVNDFDDEHTLDEEEALNEEDAKEEIDDLTKEGNMPIEELLAMYGYQDNKAEANEDKSSDSNQSTSQQSTSQQASTSSSNNASTSGSATAGSSRAAAAAAAAANYANMSEYSDSESDEDYSANEDEWRRTIQVGSDFQAAIPEGLSRYENETDEEATYITTRGQGDNRDILLWKPTTLLTDDQLDDFVKYFDGFYDDENGLPSGEHPRDDDHALYLLFQCNYDLAVAMERHDSNPNPPADATPVRKMMDPWTEDECRAFEAGLRAYGKDFFQIKHNKIATRTVGEVATFYYFWKKTERHDQFVAKYRVEKKKYALHPGTTDYMDRFLDEQENMNNLPNSLTNTVTSHNSSSLLHHPSSSNHHISLNHLSSSSSRHRNDGYARASSDNSGGTISISGHNMRTINVNASGEPQTILINDPDFNGPNQSDKPIVVLSGSGGSGSSVSSHSSSKASYSSSDRLYHHNPSSHHHSSHRHHHHQNLSPVVDSSSSAHTTIVVGKNPVVIDGAWVSSSSGSGGGSGGATSSSPTNLSTPSVSIYKIPNNPSSGFNH